MTTDPDQIRADIEQTRSSLSQDVNTLADTVNPAHAAKRKAASARAAVTGVKDRFMGAASPSGPGAGSAVSDAVIASKGKLSASKDMVAGAPATVRDQARGNPLAVGLIALGVGWLAGSLLPASAPEQQAAEMVKETAMPMVTGSAKEAADHLREPAQHAAESLKSTATDAAAAVKDDAASSAQDLKEQAQEAKGTIQDSQS
jgi:cell division septum initiation protein DivIVA